MSALDINAAFGVGAVDEQEPPDSSQELVPVSEVDRILTAAEKPLPAPTAGSAPADFGFDHRLAFEIALGVHDEHDVLLRYGLEAEQYRAIAETSLFQQAVADYKKQIMESGVGFKAKARIQAEALLDTAWDIIHNPSTPASVRKTMIDSVVQWAEYDGKKGDKSSDSVQVNLQINM